MNEWTASLEPDYVLAIGLIIVLLLIVVLIAVVVLSFKLSRMRKRYERMMTEMNVTNIEHVITEFKEKIEQAASAAQSHSTQINRIESSMKSMASKVGVVRYNAFGERGADLSFSVAILSEKQDGVVLSGIHNRDETHMYAKPITGGQSPYRLTPEEKEAINQCLLEPVESK